MRMLFLMLCVSPVLILVPTSALADCVDRVSAAQVRIQSMSGDLSPDQASELTAVLWGLCEERVPGSSVVDTDNRRVITTHGLKQERVVRDGQDDIPMYIGVDVDLPRRRHSGRFDRPETQE